MVPLTTRLTPPLRREISTDRPKSITNSKTRRDLAIEGLREWSMDWPHGGAKDSGRVPTHDGPMVGPSWR